MKTYVEVLDFHLDGIGENLSVETKRMIHAAMQFYSEQVRNEVTKAWMRDRNNLVDSMKKLEERVRELEGQLYLAKP